MRPSNAIQKPVVHYKGSPKPMTHRFKDTNTKMFLIGSEGDRIPLGHALAVLEGSLSVHLVQIVGLKEVEDAATEPQAELEG